MTLSTNILMPLGIVEQSSDNAGVLVFTRPTDPSEILPGTPIVINNEDSRYNAAAAMRGTITEVTGVTASFIIEESDISPQWPTHLDPKGAGNPVYQGLAGTFHPDFNRPFASSAEFQLLLELAEQHQTDTGIAPAGRAYAFYHLWPQVEEEDPDFMQHQE